MVQGAHALALRSPHGLESRYELVHYAALVRLCFRHQTTVQRLMAKAKKINKKMAKLDALLQGLDAKPEEAITTSPLRKEPPDNSRFIEPKTRTTPHRLKCGHWNWWLSGTKKDKNRICMDFACKRDRRLDSEQSKPKAKKE